MDKPPRTIMKTVVHYLRGRKVKRRIQVLRCCCGGEGHRVSGADVYPTRPELWLKQFFRCQDCGRYVGCHSSGEPFGHMADGETRRLRMQAHALFDPLWQSGNMTRAAAYELLKAGTGARHISWCNAAECRKIIAWLQSQS